MRYENDLRVLRDELNRLRSELDSKNENIAHLERKLREVTEMHERTLTERAANLQEFNRALDQQRMLREQRDSLTSATLLDQLSKAQEEIERLKAERISQNLSDSMAQLRLGFNNKDQRDGGQSDLTISNLEQRLKTSERNGQQLEELVRQLQNEKKDLSDKVSSITEELRMVSRYVLYECRKLQFSLLKQLSQVKCDCNVLFLLLRIVYPTVKSRSLTM